jgi:xanthine dehydrogenase accessory factor
MINLKICVRGAGELASAVAHRLYRCNFNVLLTEIANPQAVRRQVAFCEAVHYGSKEVEGVLAKLISDPNQIEATWRDGVIPVIVDPDTAVKDNIKPDVLVDAIIAKKNTGVNITDAPLVIGLGIGFYAGRDVHVVIETNRGHNLGRVILNGEAEADTGAPGVIGGYSLERVFRAPKDGKFKIGKDIGEYVKAGDVVAMVDDTPVKVEIGGIIRGILADETTVYKGMKAGDVDPRGKKEYCYTISDKGRAIAGGVLEAILSFFNK